MSQTSHAYGKRDFHGAMYPREDKNLAAWRSKSVLHLTQLLRKICDGTADLLADRAGLVCPFHNLVFSNDGCMNQPSTQANRHLESAVVQLNTACLHTVKPVFC